MCSRGGTPVDSRLGLPSGLLVDEYNSEHERRHPDPLPSGLQWAGSCKGNDAELCLFMLLSSLIVGRCSDNVAPQAPFSQILPHIADSSKYQVTGDFLNY